MRFELHVRLESNPQPRGASMSDWSRDAARRFSEKKKAQADLVAKSNRDHELIGLGSRGLWEGLCTAINEEMKAFNAEPGIEPGFLSCNHSDPMIMKVSRKDFSQKVAVITFDPERHFATVEGPGVMPPDKKLAVRVSDGDQLQFFNAENTALSEASIVEGVLKGLLES
jgi:hypothetical protein